MILLYKLLKFPVKPSNSAFILSETMSCHCMYERTTAIQFSKQHFWWMLQGCTTGCVKESHDAMAPLCLVQGGAMGCGQAAAWRAA